MRMVLVEWRDAYGSGGSWQDITDVEAANVECTSIGIVQDETEDTICLVQTYGRSVGDEGVYNYFCIPKPMILNIAELEVQ